MPTNYDKIREDNIREYGQGTRHLSFLGRLYTDRTHFIFELLQNAEDAGASKVLFQLFKDKLEVRHNGRLFNEKDVRGICGVGEGTKAEDLTQIGKFGIGFKSVYAYTTTPEIHSGDESFKIEYYVRPRAVQKQDIGDSWTTLFVFPFNKEDVEPAVASLQISMGLRKLSARTLLFLRKIKEIEYRLPDGMGGVYLRNETKRGCARKVTVTGQNNGADESESWLMFERPVDVPNPSDDGPRQVAVEIGFRLQRNEKEQREEVVRIKDSPLVVFFPTEKETRLGFLIQGPYKTTPARDNIPKDDDWNATLVSETAYLLADVLPQLKDMGLLNVSLLEALPIRMEDFRPGSMFLPIANSVRDSLASKELLPTDDDSFVSARNAKLARGADLRKLLDHEQLRMLFQSEATVKWLAGSITQDRTPELRTYLVNDLEIEEITPDSFARRITQSFLSMQVDEWLLEFYGYLSGQEALWRSPRGSGDSGGLLRSKPIVRLEDDSHVTPFRADGTTPNVFLPPPEDTDFPIVKRLIAGDEQAGNFLKRLGLSEPNVFDDIVERVLPKYSKRDQSSISETEHATDISKILRALASDSEAGKKKVIHKAKETPFLKAIDLAGNRAFKKPCDVYLESPDLRRYFSGSIDVWFLSEEILTSATDIRVLAELGIARRPRFRKMQVDLPCEEKSRLRGNQGHTRDIETIDYDLDGLDSFLSKVPQENDELIKYALIIWRFLLEHLKETDYYHFYNGQYKWFYYQERTTYFTATWKKRICSCSWLPKYGCDGSFTPSDVSLADLPEQFERNEKLADLLGMKKDIIAKLAEEAGVNQETIELAQELERNPDILKSVQEQMKKKKGFEFRNQEVVDPERRKRKILEELQVSPDKQYEPRTRSVRVSEATQFVRTWLQNQYKNENGQIGCQICKKEMPFKKLDREYYFEAVEAFTKDIFPKEHEAQFLALCPLCAAMYKELVKKDKAAMVDLIKALLNMNSLELEVPLRLGELVTTIKFVKTHLFDVKTILEEMGGSEESYWKAVVETDWTNGVKTK